MNTLRCLIADDEPIARQILERYIKDIPHLHLVASCKDAFEVMEVLQNDSAIDLLFLDINMPRLSGLSLIKTLKVTPEIIITTAYPEYAIEGFELSVTDYLLKPFSLERFLRAIGKVNTPKETISAASPEQPIQSSNALFVKSDKKIIKVKPDDIRYVEAYGNYIKIYTDQVILVPETLSHFLEKLPSHFIRIHKSFVLNFNYLEWIDGNQVFINKDLCIPIGKAFRQGLLERLG